jgi:hypothetical protein
MGNKDEEKLFMLQVNVNRIQYDEIKDFMKRKGFLNFAEAARQLIRDGLQVNKPQAEVPPQ